MLTEINYAASSWVSGKQEVFVGEAKDENGKTIPIKIRCPRGCLKAHLAHKNWHESKENGTPLIIKCYNCGAKINAEEDEELNKWIVRDK